MPEASTFLGLDFGTRRIGVAHGQSLLATAEPIATVAAQEGIPNWEELDKLVRGWRPQAIVVGIPVHMDGKPSAMTARAAKFARRVAHRYQLPVHPWDERLSSEEALMLRREHGASRAGLDAEAAALMLESYLRSLG